jgi:uncharacterized protein YukE
MANLIDQKNGIISQIAGIDTQIQDLNAKIASGNFPRQLATFQSQLNTLNQNKTALNNNLTQVNNLINLQANTTANVDENNYGQVKVASEAQDAYLKALSRYRPAELGSLNPSLQNNPYVQNNKGYTLLSTAPPGLAEAQQRQTALAGNLSNITAQTNAAIAQKKSQELDPYAQIQKDINARLKGINGGYASNYLKLKSGI